MSDPIPKSAPDAEVARILVVEDLDALRALVVRVLTVEGHQVEGVATASAAFALSADDRFDLLITDHALPGGNGAEVARRFTAVNPHLKVLFMSGSLASSLDLEVPGSQAEFLQKPFEVDELVGRVREMLPV